MEWMKAAERNGKLMLIRVAGGGGPTGGLSDRELLLLGWDKGQAERSEDCSGVGGANKAGHD